jgi:alpha-glucosidase (family GH31 glycosyl hydrolase)
VLGLTLVAPAADAAVVRDRGARFEILTPTLLRLEFAPDGRFEDSPTLTAINRRFAKPRFTTRVEGNTRVIRTDRVTVRWRRDSAGFSPASLTIAVKLPRGRTVTAQPRFPGPPGRAPEPPSPPLRTQAPPTPDPRPGPRTSGNLGGWARGLDDQRLPVPLRDGLLSRDGWYLLDDTRSPLLTSGSPGFRTRATAPSYQDGYLFAYGHDYARGLGDLRRLSGAAPLLPRRAFGNWYSKYESYSAADLAALAARFKRERVPLDVLGIDTDFKAPTGALAAVGAVVQGRALDTQSSWNGWGWNRKLFPDPAGFIRAMHAQGLAVDLNIHPSIGSADPRWGETQGRAGGLRSSFPACQFFMADPLQQCGVFDWTDRREQDAYFALHEPFERDGVDFFWLDWCCDDSTAKAAGMTQDTWINRLYAQRSEARGSRWPAFSRIGASYSAYFGDQEPGAFAEHRQAIHFTGDADATWDVLDFESRFTVAEGNLGIPYVSHDIGSFKGKRLAEDMYVRWLQLGAFQPVNRLHSTVGGFRLPWEYSPRAERIAKEFLRLRQSFVPYLYTLAREAHDRGLPLARGMYLRWPAYDEAYRYDRQYMLGPSVLVAPVGSAGDPARKDVWFPPGTWVDWFTGERHRGPRVERLSVPLARMPLFVRTGAVVPTQPYRFNEAAPAGGPTELNVWAGRSGSFRLYEDAGDGLAYRRRAYAFTRVTYDDRRRTVRIGKASGGRYRGRRTRRRWVVRLHTGSRVVTVRTRSLSTRRAHRVVVRRRR